MSMDPHLSNQYSTTEYTSSSSTSSTSSTSTPSSSSTTQSSTETATAIPGFPDMQQVETGMHAPPFHVHRDQIPPPLESLSFNLPTTESIDQNIAEKPKHNTTHKAITKLNLQALNAPAPLPLNMRLNLGLVEPSLENEEIEFNRDFEAEKSKEKAEEKTEEAPPKAPKDYNPDIAKKLAEKYKLSLDFANLESKINDIQNSLSDFKLEDLAKIQQDLSKLSLQSQKLKMNCEVLHYQLQKQIDKTIFTSQMSSSSGLHKFDESLQEKVQGFNTAHRELIKAFEDTKSQIETQLNSVADKIVDTAKQGGSSEDKASADKSLKNVSKEVLFYDGKQATKSKEKLDEKNLSLQKTLSTLRRKELQEANKSSEGSKKTNQEIQETLKGLEQSIRKIKINLTNAKADSCQAMAFLKLIKDDELQTEIGLNKTEFYLDQTNGDKAYTYLQSLNTLIGAYAEHFAEASVEYEGGLLPDQSILGLGRKEEIKEEKKFYKDKLMADQKVLEFMSFIPNLEELKNQPDKLIALAKKRLEATPPQLYQAISATKADKAPPANSSSSTSTPSNAAPTDSVAESEEDNSADS